MLVYHLLNSQYGIEDIRERRLKIARITKLDDPFEFIAVDMADRQFRHALRRTKEQLSTTKGILCFSKSKKNPVLWAHYAHRHRGICLGFKVFSSSLSKVQYVDRRPSVE